MPRQELLPLIFDVLASLATAVAAVIAAAAFRAQKVSQDHQVIAANAQAALARETLQEQARVAAEARESQAVSHRLMAEAQKLQADLALLDQRLFVIAQVKEEVQRFVIQGVKVGARLREWMRRASYLFGPSVEASLDELQFKMGEALDAKRRIEVERVHAIPPRAEAYESIGVDEATARFHTANRQVEQALDDFVARAEPFLRIAELTR